jgi:hypothetical protein
MSSQPGSKDSAKPIKLWPMWLALPVIVIAGAATAAGAGALLWTGFGRPKGNEAAAVRLAAIYAPARIAADWREQRQVCIDVLSAYLRLPYQPDHEQPG